MAKAGAEVPRASEEFPAVLLSQENSRSLLNTEGDLIFVVILF